MRTRPLGAGRELRITWRVDPDLALSILDLRAHSDRDAWTLARTADVCALDLSIAPPDDAMRELATEIGGIAPHVWVISGEPAASLASSLGLDAARLVTVSSLVDPDLVDRVLDARALTAALRTTAALRLAQRGIDDSIAQDTARDEEVLARLASYALPEGGRRRDETRRRVVGATAGRAIRILQGALGALDQELTAIREQRTTAVGGAKSLDELRVEVAAAGPPLAELPSKLAAHAQTMVLDALSQLGPALLEDLDRRVDSVIADLGSAPLRPVWPPPPRVAVAEEALVARESLQQGEDIHAEIGWTDSVLRSLDKVKARVTQRLTHDLDRITQRARAEVMRAEPLVARQLHEALESWVTAAGDVYTTWLETQLTFERATRAKAREARQSPWTRHRDLLATHAQDLTTQSRALSKR